MESKTYTTQPVKRRKVAMCKYCAEAVNKGEFAELLRCNTHFDIISELEPHIVGIFHPNCLNPFLNENKINITQNES